MEDKEWYKSKTLWGFGLMTLIAVGQTFGIEIAQSTVGEIAKYLTGLFGVYGLRSKLGE